MLVDIGAGNGAFTNSLVQSVGGEWATIVEPSKEFMTGVHAYRYPSIVAVHASLEEWSKAERAAGAPPAGRFDRMLLKEVVHHLGDSNERHESLRQLRAHRLTPNGLPLTAAR